MSEFATIELHWFRRQTNGQSWLTNGCLCRVTNIVKESGEYISINSIVSPRAAAAATVDGALDGSRVGWGGLLVRPMLNGSHAGWNKEGAPTMDEIIRGFMYLFYKWVNGWRWVKMESLQIMEFVHVAISSDRNFYLQIPAIPSSGGSPPKNSVPCYSRSRREVVLVWWVDLAKRSCGTHLVVNFPYTWRMWKLNPLPFQFTDKSTDTLHIFQAQDGSASTWWLTQ